MSKYEAKVTEAELIERSDKVATVLWESGVPHDPLTAVALLAVAVEGLRHHHGVTREDVERTMAWVLDRIGNGPSCVH